MNGSLGALTVGVVGLGAMGRGIARLFAGKGARVLVMDADPSLTSSGIAEAMKEAAADNAEVELGKGNLATVAGADLVIEAITEKLEAKQQLLQELSIRASDDLIVASNTSSLSIGQMALSFKDPERVIGMHFFNPPLKMALVEVIRGAQTSDHTARFVVDIIDALGKTPVVCLDSPHFIVNRVCRPLYYEAELLVEEGLSCGVIDSVARGALGHRMGPLALIDFTGLHTHLAASETALREYGDPRYRPIPIVRRLVRSGMLGRSHGRGFYDYEKETPREAGQRLTEHARAEPMAFRVTGPGSNRWPQYRRLSSDDEVLVYSCPMRTTREDVERVRAFRDGDRLVIDSSDAVWREELPVGAGWVRVHHRPDGAFAEVVVDEVAEIGRTSAVDRLLVGIGASAAAVPAVPGLVADRLQACLINEATAVLEAGIASRTDIDLALRLGMNHPSGPFEALDELGALNVLASLEAMQEHTGDPRYRPTQWLRRHASAERRRALVGGEAQA